MAPWGGLNPVPHIGSGRSVVHEAHSEVTVGALARQAIWFQQEWSDFLYGLLRKESGCFDNLTQSPVSDPSAFNGEVAWHANDWRQVRVRSNHFRLAIVRATVCYEYEASET